MTFNQLMNLKDGDRVWWVAEGASEISYGTVCYGVLGEPAYVEWDDRVHFDVPSRTYFSEDNADSLIHLRRDYRVDSRG